MTVVGLNLVDEGLPRALSVVPGHPDFDKEAMRYSDRIAVLFNGKELGEVAGWDVDAGVVSQRCRNKYGEVIRDESGQPAHNIFRGKVEVRWKKPNNGSPPPKSGDSAA